MLALGAMRLPSQAQTSHMLVIPASDGYGFDDCLAGNKACGQTIADAWCEAHGVSSLAAVQPLHVAAWIEGQTRERSAPTAKQHLAALRRLPGTPQA